MNVDLAKITSSIKHQLETARRYAALVFIALLAIVYGFLAWQITSLNAQEPSDADVQAKLKVAGVPHIDQNALNKIQQLQDNSVNVQALFNQARDNPFQE